MNPKKYKQIAKQVSQKHNLSEELVTDAVEFFYKRVRKALTNLEDTSVLIPKLGTFKVRTNKLYKLAGQRERALEKLNPHEFSTYDPYRRNKEILEKVNGAIEKIETLKKNRDEFYKKSDSESKDSLG